MILIPKANVRCKDCGKTHHYLADKCPRCKNQKKQYVINNRGCYPNRSWF